MAYDVISSVWFKRLEVRRFPASSRRISTTQPMAAESPQNSNPNRWQYLRHSADGKDHRDKLPGAAAGISAGTQWTGQIKPLN